jgi:hypothetical protein
MSDKKSDTVKRFNDKYLTRAFQKIVDQDLKYLMLNSNRQAVEVKGGWLREVTNLTEEDVKNNSAYQAHEKRLDKEGISVKSMLILNAWLSSSGWNPAVVYLVLERAGKQSEPVSDPNIDPPQLMKLAR